MSTDKEQLEAARTLVKGKKYLEAKEILDIIKKRKADALIELAKLYLHEEGFHPPAGMTRVEAAVDELNSKCKKTKKFYGEAKSLLEGVALDELSNDIKGKVYYQLALCEKKTAKNLFQSKWLDYILQGVNVGDKNCCKAFVEVLDSIKSTPDRAIEYLKKIFLHIKKCDLTGMSVQQIKVFVNACQCLSKHVLNYTSYLKSKVAMLESEKSLYKEFTEELLKEFIKLMFESVILRLKDLKLKKLHTVIFFDIFTWFERYDRELFDKMMEDFSELSVVEKFSQYSSGINFCAKLAGFYYEAEQYEKSLAILESLLPVALFWDDEFKDAHEILEKCMKLMPNEDFQQAANQYRNKHKSREAVKDDAEQATERLLSAGTISDDELENTLTAIKLSAAKRNEGVFAQLTQLKEKATGLMCLHFTGQRS